MDNNSSSQNNVEKTDKIIETKIIDGGNLLCLFC